MIGTIQFRFRPLLTRSFGEDGNQTDVESI